MAAQVHAATVTFELKDLQFPTGSEHTSDGTLQAKVDGVTYTVRVRGYSTTAPTELFEAADIFLVRAGAGVCDGGELPDCPTGSYAIDNMGRNDWLLFTLGSTDSAAFDSVTLVPVNANDFDASYWTGNLSKPAAGLGEMSFNDLLAQFGKGTNTSDQLIINQLGTGNFLLIGARQPDPDFKGDYFVVPSLTVTMPAVPAPASLVLFASGLVLLAGLRIRRMDH